MIVEGIKTLVEYDHWHPDMSTSATRRAYRKPLSEYKSRPDRGETLYELLSQAVIDSYQRGIKSSRDYPSKKKPRAIGVPQNH